MLSADLARLESITPVLPAGDVLPLLKSLELLLLPSTTESLSKGLIVSPAFGVVTKAESVVVVLLSVAVLLPQDAMTKLIAIINLFFMIFIFMNYQYVH